MTNKDRRAAAAVAGRQNGGSRRPATGAGEPVRFGGWSDYGEWADHDFRDRTPSEEAVVVAKRPVVVEVMTSVVPIRLPEPDDDAQQREVCRISPPEESERMARADFMLQVDHPSALIRPYLRIGRSAGVRDDDLGLETLIEAVQPYATLPLSSLNADQRLVCRTCSTPQSVAEIAVAIEAPIGLAQLIITEGIERGFLRVHSTAPVDGLPSIDLLRRVHRGLSRLA